MMGTLTNRMGGEVISEADVGSTGVGEGVDRAWTSGDPLLLF